jgi:hypothetical protein
MKLVHPEHPELAWDILGFNKETNTVRLKGLYAEIEQPMDREGWKAKGYTIVKTEV